MAAVQKCANLVELEKCCQTHIFLQNFVLIQPKTSNILPKFCQPTLSDVSAVEDRTRTAPHGRGDVRGRRGRAERDRDDPGRGGAGGAADGDVRPDAAAPAASKFCRHLEVRRRNMNYFFSPFGSWEK